MRLKIVFEPSDEWGYTAIVPALQGCISEGETLDEVRANIREAIELYLESPDTNDGGELPRGTVVEEVVVWIDCRNMPHEIRNRILRAATPEEAARHEHAREQIEQELPELTQWAREAAARHRGWRAGDGDLAGGATPPAPPS